MPSTKVLKSRKKITISINASLLQALNEYVRRTGVNRNIVFEHALLLWYRWQQEQADIAYYASLSNKDKVANSAWTKITTEAAKYIWTNERKYKKTTARKLGLKELLLGGPKVDDFPIERH